MTDSSKSPETPDVADTASFLRRFADLMSNGYNATYLQRAADLLETLTARVATSDEETLWRHKYDAVTRQVDLLETECGALKHDIEGHLNVTSSILSERDARKAALKARGEEMDQLHREREDYAAKLKVCEGELSALRVVSERERVELQLQLRAQGDEFTAFRTASGREREAFEAKAASLEAKRAELRAAVDRINDLGNQAIEHPGGADRVIT